MITFTNQQIGALLVAIGEQMWDRRATFRECLSGINEYDMRITMMRNLVDDPRPGEVADKLLALTPEEVIQQLKR